MIAGTIFWSIWLRRKHVTFYIKKIILLFAYYFQSNIVDMFLEYPAGGEQLLKWAWRMLETMVLEIYTKHSFFFSRNSQVWNRNKD
jgi:hypothetical protein